MFVEVVQDFVRAGNTYTHVNTKLQSFTVLVMTSSSALNCLIYFVTGFVLTLPDVAQAANTKSDLFFC